MTVEPNELDIVLNEFGQFGKFQIRNYAFICIPVVFSSILALSYVFTAGLLTYRCSVPECDSASSSYLEPWLNQTIPFENGVPSECTRYPAKQINELELTCSQIEFDSSQTVSCSEFIYKGKEITIQNEWDITCEDEWKLSLVGSISSIGLLIGMPIGGFTSDRFGRRFALIMGVMLGATFAIIKSLSPNYIMFVIFEFLSAAATCVIFPACIILGLELVDADHRVMGIVVFTTFFPLGEMILSLVAKYTQNWRLLIQVLCAPALLILSYFWIIPESVRWQLINKKFDSAFSTLRKVAKANNNNISEESFIHLRDSAEKISNAQSEISSNEKSELRAAFKSSIIFWRFVNCSFCWITNAFVFYGLSLNSVNLTGDKYINFILVSAVEFPALLLNYNILDRIGRRKTLCGALLICSASCIGSIFIANDEENQWWKLGTFLIGKLAITISFSALYIYTTELFPTSLRHRFLSLCSMFGRVGSIAAPQTPLIGQYVAALPMILFGGFAIASGLSVLRFPETLNTSLPSNITEAEMIGRKVDKTKV